MQQFSIFPKNIYHATYESHEAAIYRDGATVNYQLSDDIGSYVECEQVHGSSVEIVTEIPQERSVCKPACDGLVTHLRGVTLLIKHADCIPIFIYDCQKQIIGLLHSGWRGTKQKIVSHAIRTMSAIYNSKPSTIFIGIGVGAQQCCYYFEKGWDHEELLLQNAWKNFIKRHGNRYYLDMPGFIKISAMDVGIPETNIEIMPHCTICDARFHSWTRQRKDGEQSKNGVSIITLR